MEGETALDMARSRDIKKKLIMLRAHIEGYDRGRRFVMTIIEWITGTIDRRDTKLIIK